MWTIKRIDRPQSQILQLKDTEDSINPIKSAEQNISNTKTIENLLKAFNSDLGTEVKNKNNWITINHDIYGSRYSNQTVIEKNNVAKLHIKWRLTNNVEIQDPPIIIGNKGYVQDNVGTIMEFDIFDIENGKVLWKVHAGTSPTMGLTYSNGMVFAAIGSNATVIAVNGTKGKIVNYHAVDTSDNTLYITSTNRGLNYFTDEGSAGHRISPPHAMEQGLQNGTIVAMDLRTGKIIWQYKTEFPPRISPLITNDIVFTGYIPFSEQMNAKSTHMTTTKSGVVLALNKETGKKLWEFNVDAPISPVGLSIGGGMLFVPAGKIQNQPKHEPSVGGSIVAFGLN